jgi:hypothetical protein
MKLFSKFFHHYSLLVYRTATDFNMLILYPAALLKVVVRGRNFWGESLGSFNYKTIHLQIGII